MEMFNSIWKVGKIKSSIYWTISHFQRIGVVIYYLDLPIKMQGIHNKFHVSQLRKTLFDEK